jgi:hypothetical protein
LFVGDRSLVREKMGPNRLIGDLPSFELPFSGGYLHFRPVGNPSFKSDPSRKTVFPVQSIVLKANFRPGFFYFQDKIGQY